MFDGRRGVSMSCQWYEYEMSMILIKMKSNTDASMPGVYDSMLRIDASYFMHLLLNPMEKSNCLQDDICGWIYGVRHVGAVNTVSQRGEDLVPPRIFVTPACVERARTRGYHGHLDCQGPAAAGNASAS